jgi:hypothetical protein
MYITDRYHDRLMMDKNYGKIDDRYELKIMIYKFR